MTTVTKEKYCSGCEAFSPLEDFNKKGKAGYHSKCKKCVREKANAWHMRPENKERRNQAIRDKYDPKQKKNFVLKANYGINLDIFRLKLDIIQMYFRPN